MVTTRSSSSKESVSAIDKCDDGTMVSGAKRPKKTRHSSAFLSGVQISEQLDPLSFPDPPTPGRVVGSSRPGKPPRDFDAVGNISSRTSHRNRRHSSAVFVRANDTQETTKASKNDDARKKVGVLKDLTNQRKSPIIGASKVSMKDDSRSMGKVKSDECSPPVRSNRVQHTNADNDCDESLSSSDMECCSPGYATRSKRKTREKRQSILDPSECKILMEMSSEDEGAAKSKSKKRRQSIELPSQNEKFRQEILDISPVGVINEQCDDGTLVITLSYEEQVSLVNSVRKFVLGDRAGSDIARNIAELTKYPLNWTQVTVTDVKKKSNRSRSSLDLNWSSSPTQHRRLKTNAGKRALVTKFLPCWDRMEIRKKNEIASIEAATGCKAERIHGCYKYKDIRSGKLIDATEYEKRYRKYLASCAAKLHTEKVPTRQETNEKIPEIHGNNDNSVVQSDGSDMDTSATDDILPDSVNRPSVGSLTDSRGDTIGG